MSGALVPSQVIWGFGLEATVGTAVAATEGLPLLNKVGIKAGATWQDRRTAHGLNVPSSLDTKAGNHSPVWSPQLPLYHPMAGLLASLCTQNVVQAGIGPYTQTVTVDTSTGVKIENASAAASSNRTMCAWQRAGQTTSRDVNIDGVIVKDIEFNFPAGGDATVTVTLMGLGFNDNVDGSAGTYTLPAVSAQKLTTDFKFFLGDGTPGALYTEDMTIKLVGNWVERRYGGLNSLYPFALVCDGWTLEGSFSKPLIAATDSLSKDFAVEGGETGTEQLMYIQTTTLAAYNTALAADGDLRITANIQIAEPDPGLDNEETNERVTFTGVDDATNAMFTLAQMTTLTQAAWAA